jgi:ribosomal protein L5
MGHAGLESHEGSQVDRLGTIVTGEGLDTSLMTLAALTGQETERTMARSFKFTMRLNMKRNGLVRLRRID